MAEVADRSRGRPGRPGLPRLRSAFSGGGLGAGEEGEGVAGWIAEDGERADAGDLGLALERLAAVRLHGAERGVDVVGADVDQHLSDVIAVGVWIPWVNGLAGGDEAAARPGVGLEHGVVERWVGLHIPAKSLRVEPARRLGVVRRDLDVCDWMARH